ncbi:hypothetical protein EPO33_04805 [Patescibacteria group bacterium]|nr:MAG: hypothetical protein EPO33_04805 [Patescibacteria group bacterium]
MRAIIFSALMLVGCTQSPPSEGDACYDNLAEAVAIIEAGCPQPADVLCEATCERDGRGTWFGPDAANERGHCEAADGFHVRSRCRVVPAREAHLRNIQIIDGNFVGEVATGNVGPAEEFVLPNGWVATFP